MSLDRAIPAPVSGPVNASRPTRGIVIAVHNSPGSPYAPGSPMSYDVAVDHGGTNGVRIYRNQLPVNKYPEEYDVYGAGPGTDALVHWEGNKPLFTINWAAAVTTECSEGLL